MENLEEYLSMPANYKDVYLNNNLSFSTDVVSSKELFESVGDDVEIVLMILNVSPSKIGYRYWKDAVFLYIFLNKSEISVCKDIYPAIAKKYNKTPMAIERAMRICFENVMYYISKIKDNYIVEYLKSSLLYPHNGEILIKIVKIITSREFQKNKQSRFNI